MTRAALILALAVSACAAEATNLDAAAVPSGEKLVFVTSTQHAGAVGGLDGADAICAARAGEAGLEGTFKAWLSASGEPAADRLTHAQVPYVRVDGVRVAGDWADLADGFLAAAIDLDETGVPATGDVWTGTLPGGFASAADCDAYTDGTPEVAALCGTAGATDLAWTASAEARCHTPLRFYCLEQ